MRDKPHRGAHRNGKTLGENIAGAEIFERAT
jgi:hypothetical protein